VAASTLAPAGPRLDPSHTAHVEACPEPRPSDVAVRRIVGALVGVYVVLAVALAMTRTPQSDEGHFASAAAAFARNGKLVMPMWTEWISTLDQRLYANMPLYFVALGGWFKAFGVSFLGMRLFSVLSGIALVLAWSGIVRRVSGRQAGAIVGAMLVGLDYDIINLSTARYDVMCAALGALALLAYL